MATGWGKREQRGETEMLHEETESKKQQKAAGETFKLGAQPETLDPAGVGEELPGAQKLDLCT